MYFRCLGQSAFLLAHRTERMPGKEPGTYLSPCSAIPSLGCRIPVVFLVLLTCQPFMFRTVPCIRQFRTARVAAGLLRFSWHRVHLFSGKQKALEGLFPEGLFFILFLLSISYHNDSTDIYYLRLTTFRNLEFFQCFGVNPINLPYIVTHTGCHCIP